MNFNESDWTFSQSHDIVVNNKVKNPIKATLKLQIESHEAPTHIQNWAPLKIYAAFLVNSFNKRLDTFESDSELSFYFVFGSIVNPVIEKLYTILKFSIFSILNLNK